MSGGRWIDPPEGYGPRKTLYNRWVRWARQGVWRRAFEELAAAVGGLAAELMLDSTHAKAHRCAAGGKGADAQAIGHSRGGRITKLRALVDGMGRPVAIVITPGQRGDAPAAIGLLNQAPPSRTLAADTA